MNPTQREALALLAEVWSLAPDLRLGQLAAHLGFLGECHSNKGLADLEDDDLVRLLELHREELRTRQNSTMHHAVATAVV